MTSQTTRDMKADDASLLSAEMALGWISGLGTDPESRPGVIETMTRESVQACRKTGSSH